MKRRNVLVGFSALMAIGACQTSGTSADRSSSVDQGEILIPAGEYAGTWVNGATSGEISMSIKGNVADVQVKDSGKSYSWQSDIKKGNYNVILISSRKIDRTDHVRHKDGVITGSVVYQGTNFGDISLKKVGST